MSHLKSLAVLALAAGAATAIACDENVGPEQSVSGKGTVRAETAVALATVPVDVTARGTVDPGSRIATHPNRPFDVVSALVLLDGDEDGLVNDKPASDHVRWHTHPGPTIVVVTGGAGSGVTLYHAGSCEEHDYTPGEAFVAPDGIHAAWNESGSDVVLRATFLVPVGASPTAPQPVTFTDCGLPAVP